MRDASEKVDHRRLFSTPIQTSKSESPSPNNIVSIYVEASTWILFRNALCLSKVRMVLVVIVSNAMTLMGVEVGEETEQK